MWIEKGDRTIEPEKGNRAKGLWKEHINDETGESTYQEHPVKTIATYCKPQDHYFEPINPSSREVVCKTCGFVTSYVLGPQKLIDGKITQS